MRGSFVCCLVAVFCIVSGCGKEENQDWRRVRVVAVSAAGDLLHLESGKKGGRLYRLELPGGKLSRADRIPPAVRTKPSFSFRMDRDHLVVTPTGGEAIRHYINDLPARSSRLSGLFVSRFHGKRGHFMQILGVFPGGVLVREPKRLHQGSGFADAYFPVSPEGMVGAEIALPAIGPEENHKVLFLSSGGVIIAAVDHGVRLAGIDARSGERLFTLP